MRKQLYESHGAPSASIYRLGEQCANYCSINVNGQKDAKLVQ